MKSKRIVFTFENSAYQGLKELSEQEGISLAETVRRSVSLMKVLKRQKSLGFSTIILENPESLKQKEVFIDSL